MKPPASAPVWALLLGAAFWGVVWYPYRLLAAKGLDGIWSTCLTYGVALAAGIAMDGATSPTSWACSTAR